MKKSKYEVELQFKKVFLVFFILLFFICSKIFCGWNPAVFVNTGLGSRAISMGSAFVSIAGDGSSIFWNPAGLGGINNFEVSFMGQALANVEWKTLENINPRYQCLHIVVPVRFLLKDSVLGVGWMNNFLDNIPYTYLDAEGNIVRDETFQNIENAFLVSYGDRFSINDKEKIYFGLGVRFITQQFTKIEKANAFGYDIVAGGIFKSGRTNLGFMINRGIVLRWENGITDSGPLGVRLGISHKFFLRHNLQLMPAVDFIQKQMFPLITNLGIEFDWMMFGVLKDLFLRLGIEEFVLEDRYNYQQKMNESLQLTLGTGLRFEYNFLRFSLDYMYGFYRLGNKHRLSFTWYF